MPKIKELEEAGNGSFQKTTDDRRHHKPLLPTPHSFREIRQSFGDAIGCSGLASDALVFFIVVLIVRLCPVAVGIVVAGIVVVQISGDIVVVIGSLAAATYGQ